MTIAAFIAALLAMGLSPDRARVHAEGAAAAAAKHHLPIELLLGVAYIESDFNPYALSRLECATDDPKSCTRKTSVWPGDVPPPKARPSWYCGPLQAGGYVDVGSTSIWSWDECQRMRVDVAYGYEAGAKELATWWADSRCAQLPSDARLRCTLAGHDAGNAGLAAAATMPYVDWVIAARDRVYTLAAAQLPGT